MNLTPNASHALKVYGEARQIPADAQSAMRAADVAIQKMLATSDRLGAKHPDVAAAAREAEQLFDAAGAILLRT